jgi:hypothetical protein
MYKDQCKGNYGKPSSVVAHCEQNHRRKELRYHHRVMVEVGCLQLGEKLSEATLTSLGEATAMVAAVDERPKSCCRPLMNVPNQAPPT